MSNRSFFGQNIFPLGVFSKRDEVFLYYNVTDGKKTSFQLDVSRDGFGFQKHPQTPTLVDCKGHDVDTGSLSDFRISRVEGKYFLTYKSKEHGQDYVHGAYSHNLLNWKSLDKLLLIQETGVVVPRYRLGKNHVLYFGDRSVRIALSKDLKSWTKDRHPRISPYENFYGKLPLQVGNVVLTDEGILLLYFARTEAKGFIRYFLHSALFDLKHPSKLIKKTKTPLWESTEKWENESARPVGIVELNGQLLSYWVVGREGLSVVSHPFIRKKAFEKKRKKKRLTRIVLKRFRKNPILKPIIDNYWESKAVFNPAAIYEDGKVHIVYRAIGDRDVSALGYASSKDGVTIDDRHKEPVYVPTQPFETGVGAGEKPTISPFVSGGGCWGGCEDPRLTKIGNKVYMTYVAYDGRNPPRVALTSISLSDFLAHRWNWETPVLISKPGVVDKNAVVFPDKINGKYVIYHRIYPNILIDYLDDLNFDGKTKFLKGEYKIKPISSSWDSRKVGAGPPPIKTDDGWLLLYHAVGDQDPSRYKMGAMLLEKNDPTRVLYRTNLPILEPDHWYENEGHKAGVAYPCGAAVVGEDLHVYYGGADTVTCVASANMDRFMKRLKSPELAQLSPIAFRHLEKHA